METPVIGNVVNVARESGADKYYNYMTLVEKAKTDNGATAETRAAIQKILKPGLLDSIEIQILSRLHGMSDLSPELSWTLSMCESTTREEAAKKLAQKVVSKKMTENLTASLMVGTNLDEKFTTAASASAGYNGFGIRTT